MSDLVTNIANNSAALEPGSLLIPSMQICFFHSMFMNVYTPLAIDNMVVVLNAYKRSVDY